MIGPEKTGKCGFWRLDGPSKLLSLKKKEKKESAGEKD